MKAVIQHELLEALESRVHHHLQQAISTYQNLTDSELNRRSASGGWSIAQCLEHLNSYGDFYLPRIDQAISAYQGKPALTVKRGWLGNYFINSMDPDLSTKRYQAFRGHLPAVSLNGHRVVGHFIAQQERLLALLRHSGRTDLNRIRIPISITCLIRLKLGDTLEFLIIHNERHIRQADRNLSQLHR